MDTSPEQTSSEPASDAAASPAAAPAAPVATPPEREASGGEAVAPAPALPAYVPNTKFKFLDQEKEFDEWIKPVLNKDTEAKVRELYQKAYGLDLIKPKYHKTREEYQELQTKHATREKALNKLSGYLNKGDYDSFFESLQIPEQQILKYALDKVNQRELPPEQQQLYQKQREATRYAESVYEENERLKQQYEETQTRSREMELGNVLSRPEVNTLIKEYDARIGAGAFRNEVIQRGISHYAVTGQDLSAEDAVMKTLMALGGNLPQPTPQATAQQTPQGAPTLPVIPNVQGKSTSPTKQLPKSIADLKKLAREMDARA